MLMLVHLLIHLFLSFFLFFFCPFSVLISAVGDFGGQNGSSEEEVDVNDSFIDPQSEDKELKVQLLRKYSGYLGSLKQEFLKKKKNGKLPKEARQQLLEWWSRHYKWPYPSVHLSLSISQFYLVTYRFVDSPHFYMHLEIGTSGYRYYGDIFFFSFTSNKWLWNDLLI